MQQGQAGFATPTGDPAGKMPAPRIVHSVFSWPQPGVSPISCKSFIFSDLLFGSCHAICIREESEALQWTPS
jgi:hypothetical protein